MMKRFLLLGYIMGAAWGLWAQETPQTLLTKGDRYYLKKKKDSAMIFYRLLLKSFPNATREKAMALLKMGAVLEADSPGKAIMQYEKVVDMEGITDRDKGYEMLEPFANFKHTACYRAAIMYQKRKDYESALYWMNRAISEFPYITSIGNNYEVKTVNMAIQKAEILRNMDFPDSSICVLIHRCFNTDVKANCPDLDERTLTNADFYSKLIALTIKQIDNNFNREEFTFLLKKSVSKAKVKKDKKTGKVYGRMKFLELELIFPLSNPEMTKLDFVAQLQANAFYNKLIGG